MESHTMSRPFLTAVILTGALAASLPAQSSPSSAPAKVAGTWNVSFSSPQGNANWSVKLEQVVDTLRGMASTDFGELRVLDGWVEGDNLGFSLNLTYNGTPITLTFSGVVKSDTVTGKIEVPGVNVDPMPFTAVRASAGGGDSVAGSDAFDRPRQVRFRRHHHAD
jgi:hypothetical protein